MKSKKHSRVAIFLEKSINTRYTAIPAVFKIFKGQTAVLRVGLFPLHRVLRPNPSRIKEFSLPRLQVTIQIGD